MKSIADFLREWWEIAASVAIVAFGMSKKRIKEVVDEAVNPSLLTATLSRIESTVSIIDQKVDELAENVAYLNGKDEARSEGRSVVNPSNATLRLRQ